jgi:hypothetical protein
MATFVSKRFVDELIPNVQDFAKLTWRPQEFDGNLPQPLLEARKGANLSKRDPGPVMWWAHNGMQIHDNDWDLNIAHCNNQTDEPDILPLPSMAVSAASNTPTSQVSTSLTPISPWTSSSQYCSS